MKNTLKSGSVRNIIFKEDDTWYAVGLEFNIVVEADTPDLAFINLQEAIMGYVKSLSQTKIGGLRTGVILNQKTDIEYEKLWSILQGNKTVPSPYQVHSFGHLVI